MKSKFLILGFILCLGNFYTLSGQSLYQSSQSNYGSDSVKVVKKRPFIAAAQVIGINMGVWLFDRYILKGDFAYIGWNTIKENFKTGFVWDNDSFSTNLLSHPYHGSLYYNSARSNGMNFWQSFPYTLGGSLMWELFMENEPPSINDVFSTAIGGAALGEITYRLSSLILDNSKKGFNRVSREIIGAALSPMGALNRLMKGEMTHMYPKKSLIENLPFSLEVGIGWRYLAKNNYFFQGDNGMSVSFSLKYGDPFYDETYKPFDYFSLNAMFNLIGRQPIIGSVNAVGMLWGETFSPLTEHEMTYGLFQHYDFYQTSALKKSEVVPFELAQTAALGGGLMYKFPEIGNKINMSYNIYTNAILMGGVLTDHFQINDRNYNMGSGYSVKLQTQLEFNNKASFKIGLEHYRLYTWKGYPNEPNPIPLDMDINHLNAQGNKGFTYFTIINPKLDIHLSSNIKITFDPFIYIRNSYYDYFDDVSYRTFETRFLMTYCF